MVLSFDMDHTCNDMIHQDLMLKSVVWIKNASNKIDWCQKLVHGMTIAYGNECMSILVRYKHLKHSIFSS